MDRGALIIDNSSSDSNQAVPSDLGSFDDFEGNDQVMDIYKVT